MPSHWFHGGDDREKSRSLLPYVIGIALDQYAREGTYRGSELRAYQLVESIARHHETVLLGAVQQLDPIYFK